ncbi:MAG TPA: hypothetical protein VGK87_07385, partial [Anaerolineae bacterium]
MAFSSPTAVPAKCNIVFATFGCVGLAVILLSTSHHGAGLSPDSVGYIATARHLVSGAGFVIFDGTPLLEQPPLFPAVLAAVDYVFRVDPVSSANVVNGVLFGLIIYLGGLLIYRYLAAFPVYAVAGTLAILCSVPLIGISVWALSEPLFICLTLLSLIFAHDYHEKKDVKSLVLFSLSVALATLTRYIGVTLILWGALSILIYHRTRLSRIVVHLALFLSISTIPLSAWLVRNYAVSHTLLGRRAPSEFTLLQNVASASERLALWFLPGLLLIAIFACLTPKDSWRSLKNILRQTRLLTFYVITYTAFLVITATDTAYDQINDRLLSPTYVPLILVLFIMAQVYLDRYRKHLSIAIVLTVIAVLIGAILLTYPLYADKLNTARSMLNGLGYNGQDWVDSETVKYLHEHRVFEVGSSVYTNDQYAAYILDDLET